jgi:hypothetical protein
VLAGDDVVDLKRVLIEVLRYPTVFTAISRPLPDQTYQGRFHKWLRRSHVSGTDSAENVGLGT